jgi:hypothetical protein
MNIDVRLFSCFVIKKKSIDREENRQKFCFQVAVIWVGARAKAKSLCSLVYHTHNSMIKSASTIAATQLLGLSAINHSPQCKASLGSKWLRKIVLHCQRQV